VVTPTEIKTEPLAVWDCNERGGLFQEHRVEACAWAVKHLGQEVANRTLRVDFHLLDAPFAVLYQVVTDENGRKLARRPAGGPWLADPVVQMLDELPPAHLLGR
jgi:hypothetical protein